MYFICCIRVACGSKGASATAMRLDEEPRSMLLTLEDSVVSGGGACADASPQLKIKITVRKKRVILLSGSPKFCLIKTGR